MPQHVVVYRDGVGDGQFNEVLDRELPCIQNALAAMVTSLTRMIKFLSISFQIGNSNHENYHHHLSKETQHPLGL
jgi:hypothetical protein